MGSPDFAVPALTALADAGHDILRVYAQPPRPAGRGQAERPCPVHACALDRGLPVRTPVSMKAADEIAAFAALNADAGVVAAFGQILPKAVLDAPRLGCVNIHASLLPRWRGAAPIQRAVEAGDAETGITIMQMAEGLDTGDMIATRAVPITDSTTAGDLHETLAALGAEMIGPALNALEAGTARPEPQDDALATYAAKIDKAEAKLDFAQPADVLARRVRAFAPFPGAWFESPAAKGRGALRVKVLAAAAEPHTAADPGTVVDDALGIATARGVLRPLRVQPAGKGTMTAADFLRGHAVAAGTRLG
jgi:methionyl-tRNA formyltransferase